MSSTLTLSDDELAFFRLTFDLFPSPESPLRYLHDDDVEPDHNEVEQLFSSLEERALLNPSNSGAADEVRERLMPVSECSGRVTLRVGSAGLEELLLSFYLAGQRGVEYRREADQHHFGEPLSEGAIATQLAGRFATTEHIRARPLSMSAGDYLVFAVFARDLRAAPEPDPQDDDAPMSLDEILSYFDEPETKYLPTPSDESWRRSVETLCRDGVLVETASGYELHPSLHAVAREIVADRQHTVARLDYFDDQWLVREVNLYPTQETVYRLGTRSDGSVVIEELSTQALEDAVRQVVSTLPNILNPDAPAPIKGAFAGRI